MSSTDPVQQIKALALAADSKRGQCVMMVQALLGCTAPELSRLTVGEARRRVAAFPHPVMRKVVLAIIDKFTGSQDLGDSDYLIRSRKGRGQKPVNRVTVWRLLKGAVAKVVGSGAVMRVLRGIHKALLRIAEEQLRLEQRQHPLRVMARAGADGSYRYAPSGDSGARGPDRGGG